MILYKILSLLVLIAYTNTDNGADFLFLLLLIFSAVNSLHPDNKTYSVFFLNCIAKRNNNCFFK